MILMTPEKWLIVAAVLFVIEITTPGVFFFACLGIGALFASLAIFLGLSQSLGWIVLFVTSILAIYFIKPFVNKFLFKGRHPTNADALVGQKAAVIEDILPPEFGTIKIYGEIWRAEAAEKIEHGKIVEIVSISGTHAIVKLVKDTPQ